jgi:hypothetical protein
MPWTALRKEVSDHRLALISCFEANARNYSSLILFYQFLDFHWRETCKRIRRKVRWIGDIDNNRIEWASELRRVVDKQSDQNEVVGTFNCAPKGRRGV